MEDTGIGLREPSVEKHRGGYTLTLAEIEILSPPLHVRVAGPSPSWRW